MPTYTNPHTATRPRPMPSITSPVTDLRMLSDQELREEARRRSDTLATILGERLDDSEREKAKLCDPEEIGSLEDEVLGLEQTTTRLERELDEAEEELDKKDDELEELKAQLAASETRLALLGPFSFHAVGAGVSAPFLGLTPDDVAELLGEKG